MTNSSIKQSATFSVLERLNLWFSEPLGQHLLESEQLLLEKILPDLFGYHLVQIGQLSGYNLIDSTRISHSIIIQREDEGDLHNGTALLASAEFLPIATESIDVVVLPHVLEYSANPHKILREIERILIGDGHLIILGFNPWSFFGIWRILLAWRDEPPWCGHFFSFHRIRDWFTLLDFELVRLDRVVYRPPIMNIKVMQRLEFLEKLGKFCWSIFGGIYIVVVRKRVVSLTPVKDIWLKKRSMIKSGIVEPTTRSIDNA